MGKEKMMKEQQQVKEEVKTEVQEQEKVDPLVKKKIVKVKVEIFNFLPFYFFILNSFISINDLSIFLNMYSFLRYNLYRGSKERRSRCRRRRWRRRR